MLPKKSNHFIKPTADKLDQPVDLVSDAVGFFYSAIRKSLIEMEGPNIQVANLGSFKVKPKELPKLVAKYTKHLEVLKPETFNQRTLQENLKIKLERVTNLQLLIRKEKGRRNAFNQLKNERKL